MQYDKQSVIVLPCNFRSECNSTLCNKSYNAVVAKVARAIAFIGTLRGERGRSIIDSPLEKLPYKDGFVLLRGAKLA